MKRTVCLTVLILVGAALTVEAQPRPPAPRQPPRRAVQPTPRGILSINGSYQVSTHDFGDDTTFRANAEDGRLDTSYTVKGGPAFDVAGAATVWRRLAIGADISRYSRSTPASLAASIPHPFFFNRPRSVSGAVDGLKRQEVAVHVQARGIVPVSPRVQVSVFGGPSFFRVKQAVVTDFTYASTYPYDTAAFDGADTTTANESALGFNAGVDVALFFSRQVGVGGSMQFSSASVDLPAAGGATQRVDVGGASVGFGLRIRFR